MIRITIINHHEVSCQYDMYKKLYYVQQFLQLYQGMEKHRVGRKKVLPYQFLYSGIIHDEIYGYANLCFETQVEQ